MYSISESQYTCTRQYCPCGPTRVHVYVHVYTVRYTMVYTCTLGHLQSYNIAAILYCNIRVPVPWQNKSQSYLDMARWYGPKDMTCTGIAICTHKETFTPSRTRVYELKCTCACSNLTMGRKKQTNENSKQYQVRQKKKRHYKYTCTGHQWKNGE